MTNLVAISWFLNKIEHSQAIFSGILIQTFTCTAGKSFPWTSAAVLASSRLCTAGDICSPSALVLVSLGGCWPWDQHQQPAHLGSLLGPHTEHLQAGMWVAGTLEVCCQSEVLWWHHFSSKEDLVSSHRTSTPWDLLEQSFYCSMILQRSSFSLNSNTNLRCQA